MHGRGGGNRRWAENILAIVDMDMLVTKAAAYELFCLVKSLKAPGLEFCFIFIIFFFLRGIKLSLLAGWGKRILLI